MTSQEEVNTVTRSLCQPSCNMQCLMRAGEFLSNRTIDSVWQYDACISGCLAQQIFNLKDPANSLGVLSVNGQGQFVNASIAGQPTSAVYLGTDFGCQLTPAKKVWAFTSGVTQ